MKNTGYAFFDVDETLISIKSMFSFQSFYFRRRWGALGGSFAEWRSRRQRERLVLNGANRSLVNAEFFKEFQGHRQTDVRSAATDWFEQVCKAPGFFIEPVLAVLRQHQRNGIAPVFVSGSSVDILQPLADMLKVAHVLANRQEVDGGRYTGCLIPPQTIAVGKREAIQAFLLDHGAASSSCYGYGDHVSDLPLLEAVGHPDGSRHGRWPTAVP